MQPFWANLPPLCNLLAGIGAAILWSLVIGGVVVWSTHKYRKNQLPPVQGEPEPNMRVPGWYTGLVERVIFTAFATVEPTAAVAGAGGWLGLKMAANWNKGLPANDQAKARDDASIWNRHAFLGLLSGLMSMAFAWSGGALARFIMILE